MEEWRKVVGHPQYEVSNMGQVRKGNLVLKQTNDGEGYPRVTIDKEHVRVHTIEAEAFLVKKFLVNHINGNKEDNRLDNLEYVSPKTNSRLAGLNGQLKGGKKNQPVIAINIKTKEKIFFNSQSEAAKKINCDSSEINKAATGKRKTTHGYRIQYLSDYQKDEKSDKSWLIKQNRQLSLFDKGAI